MSNVTTATTGDILQEIALMAVATEEAVIVEATEIDGVAHLDEADHLTEEVVVEETEVAVVMMGEPRSSARVFVSSAGRRAI